MEKQENYSELASFTGKLFRDNFGKGPTSIYVSIEHPFITIYMRDFLAPMEKVLIKQKKNLKIEETRDLLMKDMMPELKAQIRVNLGVDVENIYYDWSLKNRSGLLLAVIKEDTEEKEVLDYTDYDNKNLIHEQIIKMSELAEKAPEQVDSQYLNDRTLVIERRGILVEIESELIRSGFSEQLRLSKRQLEKRLLDAAVFGTILGVKIIDIFVDWDFDLDKSHITFILKPN